MVILQNEARTQLFQGVMWFGGERNPTITIMKGQPGDKPISVQGYDLLEYDGTYAAFGDKKLFRYGLDTIDPGNRLFFYSLFPQGAENALMRWLVRKTGDMVTNQAILDMANHFRSHPDLCNGWCNVEQDRFNPENHAYELFAEPQPPVMKKLMAVATKS
jgi:hypothetical protein